MPLSLEPGLFDKNVHIFHSVLSKIKIESKHYSYKNILILFFNEKKYYIKFFFKLIIKYIVRKTNILDIICNKHTNIDLCCEINETVNEGKNCVLDMYCLTNQYFLALILNSKKHVLTILIPGEVH